MLDSRLIGAANATTMTTVILHSALSENVGKDEQDVLVQADFVSRVLADLQYEVHRLAFSLNLAETAAKLQEIKPAFVFNLVETVGGSGRLIHTAPALLDHLGILYSGAPTEAVFLTSNKIVAKKILKASGILTPGWVEVAELSGEASLPQTEYVIKSVWEHASVGLDEDSVIHIANRHDLIEAMRSRSQALGGDCFAEVFIDGREFNLSLLADGSGEPLVLPPAEIRFDAFPQGKKKVVGYRAKWEADSFEYLNTPRSFEFTEEDGPLLRKLQEIASECWRIFGLRGYARVDFRVDQSGKPWVLEVNTNPCISPDAGFAAAARCAGLSDKDVVEAILKDILLAKQDLSPSSPIVFREKVEATDLGKVRSVVGSSGYFSPAEVEVAVALVEEALTRSAVDSGYHFLFAERENELVGYTCFGPIACTEVGYDLYWIAVRNDLRGCGLGKELLKRSETLIQERGGRRIYVETSSREQYRLTHRFYESCAYQVEAVLKDFYSPRDDKIIYVKVLH
ncbi:MAG: GNAT family N-acetyltransferase [Desulforhabdus sp.]|nr:GNAT family N-acetyltransferase [Desulforhabdus sp.]